MSFIHDEEGYACINSIRNMDCWFSGHMYYGSAGTTKEDCLLAIHLIDDLRQLPGVEELYDWEQMKKELSQGLVKVQLPFEGETEECLYEWSRGIAHWLVLVPRFVGEGLSNPASRNVYLTCIELGLRPMLAMMFMYQMNGYDYRNQRSLGLHYPSMISGGWGDQSPFNSTGTWERINEVVGRFLLADSLHMEESLEDSTYFWPHGDTLVEDYTPTQEFLMAVGAIKGGIPQDLQDVDALRIEELRHAFEVYQNEFNKLLEESTNV